MYGIPKYLLRKLQSVQNAAAPLVTSSSKYDHVTPLLMQLYWLPIAELITFKIVFLTFKCLYDLLPFYIKELLIPYWPAPVLRSSSTLRLARTDDSMRTNSARAFATSAPDLWNQLPKDITAIDNLPTFKSKLKTFFSNIAFKSLSYLNLFLM